MRLKFVTNSLVARKYIKVYKFLANILKFSILMGDGNFD